MAGATNSGGKWDNLDGDPWYVGNGGGSNGNITINEPTLYASGGLIKSTSVNDVTLSNNTVTVLAGADGDSVYGATIDCYVPGTVTMEGNRVFIKGGNYNSVEGALVTHYTIYQNTPILKDNHVVIEGGSFNDMTTIAGAGGWTNAQSDLTTATGNSLTINAGTFGYGYDFYGAWLRNSRSTSVNGNSVTITGGTSASDVMISGGSVIRITFDDEESTPGHFTANDNVVDLGNVTLDDVRISGGGISISSDDSGSATGNKVILREGLTLTGNSYLYGGYSDSTGNANLDVRTGNTLEVRTFGLTATNVRSVRTAPCQPGFMRFVPRGTA